MTDDKREHDFDWIGAYLDCSIDCELVELKHAAKACTEKYSKAYQSRNPGRDTAFSFEQEGQKAFLVRRDSPSHPYMSNAVRFTRKRDHVLIERTREQESYRVTVTLNIEGDCRYQVNSSGQFLRWQILQSALYKLFLLGSDKDGGLVWGRR